MLGIVYTTLQGLPENFQLDQGLQSWRPAEIHIPLDMGDEMSSYLSLQIIFRAEVAIFWHTMIYLNGWWQHNCHNSLRAYRPINC